MHLWSIAKDQRPPTWGTSQWWKEQQTPCWQSWGWGLALHCPASWCPRSRGWGWRRRSAGVWSTQRMDCRQSQRLPAWRRPNLSPGRCHGSSGNRGSFKQNFQSKLKKGFNLLFCYDVNNLKKTCPTSWTRSLGSKLLEAWVSPPPLPPLGLQSQKILLHLPDLPEK